MNDPILIYVILGTLLALGYLIFVEVDEGIDAGRHGVAAIAVFLFWPAFAFAWGLMFLAKALVYVAGDRQQ